MIPLTIARLASRGNARGSGRWARQPSSPYGGGTTLMLNGVGSRTQYLMQMYMGDFTSKGPADASLRVAMLGK
jgi:hypothetical protein